MSKLMIAVDLAKDVFEIAVAKPSGTIIERKRLTRPQFERFWQTRETCAVVMEACGSAHHWARQLWTSLPRTDTGLSSCARGEGELVLVLARAAVVEAGV